MALQGKIVDTRQALEPYLPGWDALAVERELPYCAPGWLLPWWDHVAGPEAVLRPVMVHDGDELIGVAPFYAREGRGGLGRYGLMGAERLTARIEPLARTGREAEVADVFARALASARPVPGLVRFEGLPADSPWLGLLGRAWPGRGRPFVHREAAIPAPTVTLEGHSFDTWMKSKSSNFRQQMRRSRRQLEEAGAVFRTAESASEVADDLAHFERLHRARWESRGGSGALKPGVMEMLRAAGGDLVESRRLRIESIEVDGRVIASHLFVSAGRETSYWLGGFDDDYARQKPSMAALVTEIEASFARGDQRFDLGPGAQDYKYRLCDREDTLDWLTFVPPGPHYGRAMAALAPVRARYAITARMSPEQKTRLRRVLRRPVAS